MSLGVHGVNKSFGGLRVVDDVSFQVQAAELTGLIGPNGAGKSTLFAVISGFQPADAGCVRFDGHEIQRLSAAARARLGIARTFQVPRPFAHLTVRENLLTGARDQPGEHVFNLLCRPGVVRQRERQIVARADAMLEFLGLTRVAGERAGALSGGQQKLLELGRALMTEPRFILLDEPYAGVNPVLIEEIERRIRTLSEQGTGFLIVEHNLPALARLAARLLVMDRGRLIASGTPAQVLADRAVQEAYIGGGP
ncbi:MAG: ABC transporter ATP-binding protein [Acidisphaera sp.]|nr:ABC transporter ATP-binding protein [Acidisphaera sp.]